MEAATTTRPQAEDEPGQTAEDLAENDDIEEPDDEQYIEGATGQMSLKVGGKNPTASKASLRSAAVSVEGQFDKGSTVELRVIARCDEVKFTDTHDEYGVVTATTRTHVFKPVSVEKVASPED